MIDKLIAKDPACHEWVDDELYVIAYGETLTENIAQKWVAAMKNKDGTTGGHWSEADTNQVAKQMGITFNDFNSYEWYAVLNMMYSDYYGSVPNDTSTYAKLARDWMKDEDGGNASEKTYRYYRYVVEKQTK